MTSIEKTLQAPNWADTETNTHGPSSRGLKLEDSVRNWKEKMPGRNSGENGELSVFRKPDEAFQFSLCRRIGSAGHEANGRLH